jgi:hypothetical protein
MLPALRALDRICMTDRLLSCTWQAKKTLDAMRDLEEYEPMPDPVLNLGTGVVGKEEQADMFPFFEGFLDGNDTQGLEGGQTSERISHLDMLDDVLFERVSDFRQAVSDNIRLTFPVDKHFSSVTGSESAQLSQNDLNGT